MPTEKPHWFGEMQTTLEYEGSPQLELYSADNLQAIDSNLLSESVADLMWEILVRKVPEYAKTRHSGTALRAVHFRITVTRKAVPLGQKT